MKSILSSILNKFSKKSFKWFSILGCFLGDLLFILFYKTAVLIPENFNNFLQEYSWIDKISRIQNLPETSKLEILKLIVLSLNVFIIIYLIIALFFYFLFYKEKKWGIDFVKSGTALFGILFSVVTVLEAFSISIFWAFVFIALIPIYIIIFFGTRKFF